MSAHVPIRTNRRRRIGVALIALAAMATGIAPLATSATGVSAAEPSAAAEPVIVNGELSLEVDGTIARPEGVGAMAGPSGRPGFFVIGEVVVHSNDLGIAAKLAERFGGTIVDTVQPAEQQPDDALAITLVRFDPKAVDTSTVLKDLAVIAGDAAHGRHVVSDAATLATLAAAAQARLDGHVVDLNWVADLETIRNRSTTEAPTGPTGYTPDAFTWSQLTDLNVPAAWNLLARAGLLTANSVPVAVVDNGFGPANADRPAGIADGPRLNPLGCGGACPQHGENVASTLVAAPDNAFGGAGTAGPVARAILLDLGGPGTTFAIQAAETRAIAAGARIINMSIGGSVPTISEVLIGGFNGFTAGVRQAGILQFAAAGNAGVDVDAMHCFIVCSEAGLFFPCELAGTVCVGGIVGFPSFVPHPSSNFGSGGVDLTATVELWADFCAFVGPDLVRQQTPRRPCAAPASRHPPWLVSPRCSWPPIPKRAPTRSRRRC